MTTERADLLTMLLMAFAISVLILTQGCVMPFSGERNTEGKVNILGNTVEWKTSVAGTYEQTKNESGVAR